MYPPNDDILMGIGMIVIHSGWWFWPKSLRAQHSHSHRKQNKIKLTSKETFKATPWRLYMRNTSPYSLGIPIACILFFGCLSPSLCRLLCKLTPLNCTQKTQKQQLEKKKTNKNTPKKTANYKFTKTEGKKQYMQTTCTINAKHQ